jgi:hypothetical protein
VDGHPIKAPPGKPGGRFAFPRVPNDSNPEPPVNFTARATSFQNQETALASRIERLKQRLEKEPAGPDRTRLVNLQQELEAKLRSLTENPAIFP